MQEADFPGLFEESTQASKRDSAFTTPSTVFKEPKMEVPDFSLEEELTQQFVRADD